MEATLIFRATRAHGQLHPTAEGILRELARAFKMSTPVSFLDDGDRFWFVTIIENAPQYVEVKGNPVELAKP